MHCSQISGSAFYLQQKAFYGMISEGGMHMMPAYLKLIAREVKVKGGGTTMALFC